MAWEVFHLQKSEAECWAPSLCAGVSPPTVVTGGAVVVEFVEFFPSCDGAKKVACVDSHINVPLTGPAAVIPSEIQTLFTLSKYLQAASLPAWIGPTLNVNLRGLERP